MPEGVQVDEVVLPAQIVDTVKIVLKMEAFAQFATTILKTINRKQKRLKKQKSLTKRLFLINCACVNRLYDVRRHKRLWVRLLYHRVSSNILLL